MPETLEKRWTFKQKNYYDPSVNKRQMLAHQCSEKFVLYGGAYSGGKTAWLINEFITLLIEFPGNVGFIGCRDGTDFERNAMTPLLKFLPSQWFTSCKYKDANGTEVSVDAGHNL